MLVVWEKGDTVAVAVTGTTDAWGSSDTTREGALPPSAMSQNDPRDASREVKRTPPQSWSGEAPGAVHVSPAAQVLTLAPPTYLRYCRRSRDLRHDACRFDYGHA